MKKIVLMLTGLFMALSVFMAWNTTYAATADKLWDSDIWINFWNNCLTWMGRGCFHYEKIIWIDKNADGTSRPDYTATTIAQDLIFAATYMVWTVLTIVLIYCWIRYIIAARWWEDPKTYKNWLIKAAIWALLVRWSYAIVRLIQYIAKWW